MGVKDECLLWLLQCYARHFPVSFGKRRVLTQASRMLSKNLPIRVTTLRPSGLKMRCDVNKFIQRELFLFGSYEADDCRTWVHWARGAMTVFDVGANVGLYSLLAAHTSLRASIHAFEPTPVLSSAFDENIRLNGFENIINNRLAVGDRCGEVFLNFCSGSDASNEGMNFVTKEKLQENNVIAESVTIDQYCHKNDITRVDLMKLDVEGGEYAVLRGAAEMLQKRAIGCILFELIEWAANRSGTSTTDVKRLLSGHGYEIWTLQGRKRLPLEVEGSAYEGNALAVPKGNPVATTL